MNNHQAIDNITIGLNEFRRAKQQIHFFGKNPNVRFGKNKPVYLSILTNGYTKILRFDNNPPAQPTHDDEESKQGVDNVIGKAIRICTKINIVNISIISPGKELMTLYLKGIMAKVTKTKKNLNFVFNMQNIQLDN